MIVETVKVYKSNKDVTINKTDLEEWNAKGWKTSSQQKKKKGDESETKADKAD